jgi:uncharacterized membrane protein
MLQGLVYLPLFIYETVKNPDYFTFKSILFANGSTLCITLGITSFTYAMQFGKGSTVQAI